MNLVLQNVVKSFDKKQVLKGADFSFEKGKIYGLIGRNGAGKTTLFNCISGDLAPDSGEVFTLVDGTRQKLDIENIGFVLSEPVVPEFLTAREFIKFFIEIQPAEKQYLTVDEYLEWVGILAEDRDKLLRDFSHGMKNKMQMLINFIAEPTIMLLDEPLTSLDIVAADEMKKMFRRNRSEHITILSTHILELALDLCDEIVILNNGTLSEVLKNDLETEDFKERIIAALRGDADA